MKQLKTDEKVDAILDRLNEPKEPEQGVFFNGQIFDAYAFIAKLIRMAKKQIVVIDSNVDDSLLVLVQLSKRNPGVTVQYENEVALIKLTFSPIIPQYILPGRRCGGSDVLRR